ncbi:hypothetical protein ACFLWG_02900 [Chloroflexota bacterium]
MERYRTIPYLDIRLAINIMVPPPSLEKSRIEYVQGRKDPICDGPRLLQDLGNTWRMGNTDMSLIFLSRIDPDKNTVNTRYNDCDLGLVFWT